MLPRAWVVSFIFASVSRPLGQLHKTWTIKKLDFRVTGASPLSPQPILGMESLRYPLAFVETNASKCPSSAAFKIPRCDVRAGQEIEWQTITHAQFKQDVELFGKYWSHVLRSIPPRSVVGIW
jgi:hypothetical protein